MFSQAGLLLDFGYAWIWPLSVVTGAVLLALVAHRVVFFVLGRMAARKGSVFTTSLVQHARGPLLWVLPFLALLAALPEARLSEEIWTKLERLAGLGLVATVAWLVILFSEVVSDLIAARYRVEQADTPMQRRVHTQIVVLHRIVATLVIVVAISVMLMTFPEIKHIGMSLLASAGLAGLVVGMAMKETLSSLIGGIQIAFTQALRIGDSVVVENEFGWVEEIGTTYVVVRIWDLRRMVLPLSYFLQHPFQNWTRFSADLLCPVLLYLDYTAPVEDIRNELQRIAKSTEKWRGQVCRLDVSDADQHTMQVRALVDARDADSAWDLKCYVREKLIQFLQTKHPEALPRVRTDLDGAPARQVAERAAVAQAGGRW